jgi:hypothetical protein
MKLSEFYNQLSPKSDKGTEHDYIIGEYKITVSGLAKWLNPMLNRITKL